MCFYFPAFITVNLFGQTTNVWIGLKSDNHETWVNRKPVVYSNWSPSDVLNVSFKLLGAQLAGDQTGVLYILTCVLYSKTVKIYFFTPF